MAKDTKKAATKGSGLTKTAIYDDLAQQAGITRKQVAAVFDALTGAIKRHLKKDRDVFKVPGLFRLELRRKKAVKGGELKPNPFKPGEMITTKPKAASNVIKIRPLKSLKDQVQ
jgi:nucleoid DNA-binding protein